MVFHDINERNVLLNKVRSMSHSFYSARFSLPPCLSLSLSSSLCCTLSYLSHWLFFSLLRRRARCLGKDFVRSSKIIKWLWAEDKLGEGVGNVVKLAHFLKDFHTRCYDGTSRSF